MKTSIRVEGLKELDARLGELTKATGRAVLRRVLLKAGQPMADRMADLAPDDPATGGKDLKRSILVSSKLKNRIGAAEFAAVKQAGGSNAAAASAMRDARRAMGGGSFAEVFVGPAARIFYAHLQEFGTVNHGPQAFARPAFEEKKGTVIDIVKAELGVEIDKAVQRAKRRAAKAAAGGG